MKRFHRLILVVLLLLPLVQTPAVASGGVDLKSHALQRRQLRLINPGSRIPTFTITTRPSRRTIRRSTIRRTIRRSTSSTGSVRSRRPSLSPRSSSSSSARSSSSLRPATRSSAPSIIIRDAEPSTEIQAEVWRLTNAERAKAGLPAYTYNADLERSAQDYAEKMEREDFFSHTAPDGGVLKDRMHASGYYVSPEDRNCDCGMSFSYGENIALGQQTAADVVEDWMNSPSHRAAILSSEYLEMGVGKSGNYWVQHFGAAREL